MYRGVVELPYCKPHVLEHAFLVPYIHTFIDTIIQNAVRSTECNDKKIGLQRQRNTGKQCSTCSTRHRSLAVTRLYQRHTSASGMGHSGAACNKYANAQNFVSNLSHACLQITFCDIDRLQAGINKGYSKRTRQYA